MTPIVGLGAGSHARSLIDAIRSAGEFEVVAVADDDSERWGQKINGVPIVDPTELGGLPEYAFAFVGVGGITDPGPRIDTFERLSRFLLPVIVHGGAMVCEHSVLKRGAQVLVGAIVNDNATICAGAIVNSGAIVEHDCVIGPHAHVAPGAVLGGNVTVGYGCHIGLGAVIREGVTIGDRALVAAGAVVLHDVPAGEWVCGVPAHEMRRAA